MNKSLFTCFVLIAGCLLAFAGCAKPQYLSTEIAGPAKTDAGGCTATFTTTQACVVMKWEKLPTESEMGSFIFLVSSAGGDLLTDPASDTPLKIVLWMPSMGHGSSPVTVEKLSTGLYRAKNVFFSMKGDWEIRFQTSSDQATYALIF